MMDTWHSWRLTWATSLGEPVVNVLPNSVPAEGKDIGLVGESEGWASKETRESRRAGGVLYAIVISWAYTRDPVKDRFSLDHDRIQISDMLKAMTSNISRIQLKDKDGIQQYCKCIVIIILNLLLSHLPTFHITKIQRDFFLLAKEIVFSLCLAKRQGWGHTIHEYNEKETRGCLFYQYGRKVKLV